MFFIGRLDFIVTADPKLEGKVINIITPSTIRKNTREGTRIE